MRRRHFQTTARLTDTRWRISRNGGSRGAPIVYIGKAGTPTSKGGLKSRLSPFSRKARSHSGGRSIWQLDDADELLVCWIKTPGLNPRHVEEDYLDEFARVHLRQPFANVDGR